MLSRMLSSSSSSSLKHLKDNSSQVKSILSSSSTTDRKLKTWHLAILIGIPSATLATYLLYKYYMQNDIRKNSNEKAFKEIPTNTKSTFTNQSGTPDNASTTDQINSSNKTAPKSQLDEAIQKKNKGNEFFQQGNFEKAAELYTAAIDTCPKNDKQELPKFYQNRAAAYENLKLHEKVVEDCSRALELDPSYTKALTRRAKAYENMEKFNESFEDLTSLCILQKFSANSMALADKVVKKIGQKMAAEIFSKRKGLPVSQHFVNNFFIGLKNDVVFNNAEFYDEIKTNETSKMKDAVDAFNKGDYNKCIEYCSEEINNSNNYVLEAKNLRGSLYMLKCQYDESKDDFNSILNDSRSSNRLKSNSLIKLTALNLQNSQDKEAFENYEKAIELDPTNEDIYCNRAQVHAMKNNFAECFKDFDTCLEINPSHKVARLQKAFFEFRQFYTQLSIYLQATQTSQEELSRYLENSKELRAETEKLEKIIHEHDDVPEAYNLYAQILSEQENFAKAEQFYEKALLKDPKNAALIVQRALNLMTWKNDLDLSIDMLNTAIEVDNTCEFAYETLATVEIQRGNLERAVELFEKAIELTRTEESMMNLCSMLVGAKTQFKLLSQMSRF